MLHNVSQLNEESANPLIPAAASEAPWYCVLTEHAKEHLACRSLEAHGYETLYAVFLVKKKNYHITTKSLLPGYVFARLPETNHWPRMQNIRGCKGILTVTEADSEYRRPVPVSHEKIQGLMQLAEDKDEITKLHPRYVQRIKPGATVRILTGTFKGHYALCQLSETHRIGLLLHIFERQLYVEFSNRDVEPA